MKIASGYKLMTIVNENVVVPLGEKNINLKSLVSLNDSGAFLWRRLEGGATEDELLAAMLEEYDIEPEKAMDDIKSFIDKLQSLNILE